MLETEEKTQEDRHLVIEAEEGRRLARLLDEGDIGLEEEGIVVVANEAVPVVRQSRRIGM